MVGLMLMCLIAVAIPAEDDAALRYRIDDLVLQLRSLQESVQKKESLSLEQDRMILHLQRQLQGVKASQYEELLKKRKGDLSALQVEIQHITSDIKRLGSDYQQLESLSANQRKQLHETQLALHLVEEQIMQAQGSADHQDGIFHKERWMPNICNLWNRTVYLAGEWYRVLHTTRLLKTLSKLKEQILMQIQMTQKVIEEKAHASSEACKIIGIKMVKTLRINWRQPNFILQPYISKFNQQINKGLKYGIDRHLQLQRRIRKAMQRNRYLASKESKEVVWFLASAMLIVPLYGALILSSFVGERRRPSAARSIVRQRRRHGAQLRHTER